MRWLHFSSPSSAGKILTQRTIKDPVYYYYVTHNQSITHQQRQVCTH